MSRSDVSVHTRSHTHSPPRQILCLFLFMQQIGRGDGDDDGACRSGVPRPVAVGEEHIPQIRDDDIRRECADEDDGECVPIRLDMHTPSIPLPRAADPQRHCTMLSHNIIAQHHRSYCSLLQNTRTDSARGVSLWRTALPSLRFNTRPAIASLRTWSEAFSYPIPSRSEISSTESSGSRLSRSSISSRR